MKQFDIEALARVNTLAIECSATIRVEPEHFQVIEQLPFEPDGVGGHVWLKIQKRGINTDWLAGELAKFAGVPQVAVGYAGLKDRHAVTTQWFSVNMEGVEHPNWAEFATDDISIVEQTAHGKKLKRGVLAGNQFKLILSNVSGDSEHWQQALELVKKQGVPNYFGEQRFGHNGSNLNRADHWFVTGKAPKKRNQKSIYLSAGRSWLFNLILAQRIKANNWNQALVGDVMALAGTKASSFVCDAVDDTLKARVASMDIHPTGALWGRGRSPNHSESLQLEHDVLSDWSDWQQGLEKAGLSQERRALRLFPEHFSWQFLDEAQLELQFFLPAGSYATSIMRELAIISDAQHRNYQDLNVIPLNEAGIKQAVADEPI